MHSSSTVLPPISDLFHTHHSTHTSSSMSRSSVLDIANLLSSPATSESDYHHRRQHHSHATTTTHQRSTANHRDLKAKRKRASPNQLVVLNRIFNQTYFPSTEIRIELGKQLGMSPRTVQIWFQNKRQALRSRGKHHDSPPSSFYLPPISPPRSPSSDLCQPNYSLPPLRLVPPHASQYQHHQYQYQQQQQQYSPSMSYPSPNSIDHLPYREY
ncbi:hypothetical protein V8B55DRAFT_1565898 [Mucor lusitanicus]|uniref:Homeobox domain-containing protein n=2 Tax=Mucor circinelloides f. lusitanicus TaxID=29924 RepID=A0A8H4BFV4_MUCCL|nr:hypothetical protein FB192DRAFT_1329222 [Mucor lusitanicus]